jgi:transcriptional regulator with XRE-family HTH domain
MNASSPNSPDDIGFRTISGVLLDLDRFEVLCEYLNMSQSRLSQEAGLNKGFLGRIKRGEVQAIEDESLAKIAQYAAVPKNFFFAKPEKHQGAMYGWELLGQYDFDVNYEFIERGRNLTRIITINDDLSTCGRRSLRTI